MTLEQLRVFVAVADALHVTRAAEQLHMTQSAASASIATLEARYETKLFHRVGRGIELTREGAEFLPEARALLQHAAAVELSLGELSGHLRGELRVAASQTVVNEWLPVRVVRFHACFPDVVIRLTSRNTEQAARAVLDGSADIAVVEGMLDPGPFVSQEVPGDRLVLVLPQAHALVGQTRVTSAMLSDAAWVMRERGSGTRRLIESALSTWGVVASELNVVLEMPSNESVLAAVEAGAGISAISELAARRSGLPMIDLDLPHRRFTVLRHGERTPNRALQALIDLLVGESNQAIAASPVGTQPAMACSIKPVSHAQ
ncbi:MAG: LysR family transcriptional regulator [Dokdonella sp.]